MRLYSIGELKLEITELRLKTHCLSRMRAFYAETLEWPLVAETADSLTMLAGNTRLVFEQNDDGSFIYHFAFNIPENQFAQVKGWLAARTPLMVYGDMRCISKIQPGILASLSPVIICQTPARRLSAQRVSVK